MTLYIVSGFQKGIKPINKTVIVNEQNKTMAKVAAATIAGASWTSETLATPLITEPVTFRVDPVAKPRMTRSDKWKERPAVVQYWAFKDGIRKQAEKIGFQLADAFEVDFYIPMPYSWSNSKMMDMDGQPHRQKPDADNLIKALKDALCLDDSYIWDEHPRKFWAYEGSIVIRNVITEYHSQA